MSSAQALRAKARLNVSKPYPNFKPVIEAAEANKASTANSSATIVKKHQTESSTELDSVALRGCSIYTDPQVPPKMKSEIRTQKRQKPASAQELRERLPRQSEVSNRETIVNVNIDRTNSNISLPDRVEGIIESDKTSDFRLQTSNFERSDCVPPPENINKDNLVASLLDRSEKLISLEIPTDEEPQPGERVYSPITEQKGILQSFGCSYSRVIWDGTKTARSIYSHVIQKLEEVEVDLACARSGVAGAP